MVLKLIVLSLVCLAFLSHPVHCHIISDISALKSAAADVASDVIGVAQDVAKAKRDSLVNAVSQTGNIIATGAGLKAEALQHFTYDVTHSVANGLVSVGRLLSRLGTGFVEDKLDASPYADLGTNVDYFNRIYHRRFRPVGHGLSARPTVVYDIVYTPRVYRGPYGTFRIE